MTNFIKKETSEIPLTTVVVKNYRKSDSTCLTESTVLKADLSNPIIVAEISPNRFNVIDGNHRVEKAYRDGVETLPAYTLRADQHLPFLISEKAYRSYIGYWNEKIRNDRQDQKYDSLLTDRLR